jgi:hypothetical protein
MPMCTDGKYDMFEPHVWDEAKYNKDCAKKFWGVKPAVNLVTQRYGGLDSAAASSNIIFRYVACITVFRILRICR